MFQIMPAGPPAAPVIEKKGIKGTILNIYYDPFKWAIVKSIGLFALGIKTAIDFDGFDVLNPNT
ncbi:UNVERIFIED_CONTAM: hypothetical protein RMT77_003184 [Armadillidium vulgare]